MTYSVARADLKVNLQILLFQHSPERRVLLGCAWYVVLKATRTRLIKQEGAPMVDS